jgi:hypothetical protein
VRYVIILFIVLIFYMLKIFKIKKIQVSNQNLKIILIIQHINAKKAAQVCITSTS